MDVLGYIDPNITVNLVRDGKLEVKTHLELPETLTNVLTCKNPRCITSVEQGAKQRFYLADKEKKIYRCSYCDVEHENK
jgi:aspartate carbamoyltransferase regulatory subunit